MSHLVHIQASIGLDQVQPWAIAFLRETERVLALVQRVEGFARRHTGGKEAAVPFRGILTRGTERDHAAALLMFPPSDYAPLSAYSLLPFPEPFLHESAGCLYPAFARRIGLEPPRVFICTCTSGADGVLLAFPTMYADVWILLRVDGWYHAADAFLLEGDPASFAGDFTPRPRRLSEAAATRRRDRVPVEVPPAALGDAGLGEITLWSARRVVEVLRWTEVSPTAFPEWAGETWVSSRQP